MSDLPELPPRDPQGHKGTFGGVLVVGGHAANPVMVGGPALAARAALRAGCGLCTLAMPAPLLASALSVAPGAVGCALPVDGSGSLRPSESAEAIDAALSRATAVVAGPGLGGGFVVQQVVLRLASSVHVPLVLDADALNALASAADFARDLRAPAVLTPHPGEHARLAAALGLEPWPEGPAARAEAARALAGRLGCVVALKGACTVVSDGHRSWTCGVSEPALATGGSGDALSGVLGGLAAQFVGRGSGPWLDLFAATCLAVQLHAESGQRWAARHGHAGMLPEEIADGIPDAMAAMRDRAAADRGATATKG